MKGGGDYHLGRQVYAINRAVLGLAGKDAHKGFNCQQRCCVVAQVGPGLHDRVDLFDCVLWLGLGGHGVDLGF